MYERVLDTLRKDLWAAKLTEQNATSDLAELRKQESIEKRNSNPSSAKLTTDSARPSFSR